MLIISNKIDKSINYLAVYRLCCNYFSGTKLHLSEIQTTNVHLIPGHSTQTINWKISTKHISAAVSLAHYRTRGLIEVELLIACM